MNDQDFKQIEDRYFVISKGRVWYFVGGAVGAIVAVGIISYKAAVSVLDSTTAAAVLRDMQARQAVAKQTVEAIQQEAAKLKASEAEFDQFVDVRLGIYDRRDKLRDERARLSPIANAKIFNQPSQAPEAKKARARIEEIDTEIQSIEDELGLAAKGVKK